MDLADLEASYEDPLDPTTEVELGPDDDLDTSRPGASPGPAMQQPDWSGAPELPEPPVSFAPPEMTLPERLPDAGRGSPPPNLENIENLEDLDGPDGSAYAAALGTPELPDRTPTSDALARKLRQARPTQDLVKGSGGGRRAGGGSDFESAVISKVVDMSPSVMQMNPTAEHELDIEDSTWSSQSETGSGSGSGSAEYVTDVWAEGVAGSPPGQAQHIAKAQPSAPSPPSPPPPPSPPSLPSEPSEPSSARKPATPSVTLDKSVVAGRYRVLKRIGVGGMARIFLVQHLELGKHFALKIIHTALSDDTKIRDMFYREARLASSLDHPNIVLGVDDDYGAFIVMEYLKGETLHARLRREGRLHPNVACEVAMQVAEALLFIHGRDVVHCDIKSENIFLCEPPPEARRRIIVKLLDFGLSRQKIGSGRVSISEVGGTPAYMAPERINRLSPRPSMDIYSFGVLFYEMLTGTLPFMGTMEEVLIAQLKKKPEPVSARMKDRVDDRMEELVMKALQKDPNKRQKDMGAFIYELRTVMDMLGIGRRRGKQPMERVRSGQAAARVKNCELLVADCPLPLFMTDPRASLVLANKAFASFVNLTVNEISGVRLKDTRLGRVCPEILEDLHKVITTRTQTQRILSFPWRTAKRVSMMIWLKPEIVDDKVVAISGVIHPFNTSSKG